MWRWILLLNGLNSQIRMKVLAETAPDLRLRNNLCYLDHLYAIINSERLIFILEIPNHFQKMPNWTILDKSKILVTKQSSQ